MAMDAGDETVGSGTLSKAIYDALNGEFGADTGDADDNRKKFSSALANAVVDHIAANADVTITTSDSGLQRNPEDSADTLAPGSNKTLSGAVS